MIEELEASLTQQSDTTISWAEALGTGLLRNLDTPAIFLEAANILSSVSFERFLAWAFRSYPQETLKALSDITRSHAAAHAVLPKY